MNDQNKNTDIVNTVIKLSEAIPVYEDLLRPAAKQVGNSLETVAKTVDIALSPLSGMIWGWEKVKEYIIAQVSLNLENTPPEKIIVPDPLIAGPVLESLRFTEKHEELQGLFSKLLASSMDESTAKYAHPGFVPILNNICPDEARIIRKLKINNAYPVYYLISVYVKWENDHETMILENYSDVAYDAKIENKNLTFCYIDNLVRLGLIQIINKELNDKSRYKKLITDPIISNYVIDKVKDRTFKNCRFVFKKKFIQPTSYGKQFIHACVK